MFCSLTYSFYFHDGFYFFLNNFDVRSPRTKWTGKLILIIIFPDRFKQGIKQMIRELTNFWFLRIYFFMREYRIYFPHSVLIHVSRPKIASGKITFDAPWTFPELKRMRFEYFLSINIFDQWSSQLLNFEQPQGDWLIKWFILILFVALDSLSNFIALVCSFRFVNCFY